MSARYVLFEEIRGRLESSRKRTDLIDAAKPHHCLARKLRLRAYGADLRHPASVDLPHRAKQFPRRRHVRGAGWRIVEPSSSPGGLPFRGEPKVHPERQVDQND